MNRSDVVEIVICLCFIAVRVSKYGQGTFNPEKRVPSELSYDFSAADNVKSAYTRAAAYVVGRHLTSSLLSMMGTRTLAPFALRLLGHC